MISLSDIPLHVSKTDGPSLDLGGVGVRFKIRGKDTGGRVSVVEHPVGPRRLVPPHVHHREDVLSYVVEGTFGARVGDQAFEAGPGTYIHKPCGVPNTYWNPTDEPALLVEIFTPAGFEDFFLETAEFVRGGGRLGTPEHARIAARYEVEFLADWVPELMRRYGLKMLGE